MGKKNIISLSHTRSLKDRRVMLAVRLILVVIVVLLIGVVGITSLSYNLASMKKNYYRLIDRDYENLNHVNEISSLFFEHQALAFRYIDVIENKEEAAMIEERAKVIEEELIAEEKEFGDSAVGTQYESEYHNVVSDMRTYLSNMEYVFDFNDYGDRETADFYMKTELSASIDTIIHRFMSIKELIDKDVVDARGDLSKEVLKYNRLESFTILLMVLISGIGLIMCIYTALDMVNNDSLTQIYNVEKMQRYMAKRHRRGKLDGYSCICTNIKGLALINQRYTSVAGDITLREYAYQMKKTLKNDERIARIGGDNFLMIVRDENTKAVIDKINSLTFKIDTGVDVQEIKIENRCGVYKISNTDPFDSIMNAAYVALNNAKKNSSENVVWFDRKLLDEAYDRKILITQYKKGIINKEFEAFYQPKTDISTETLEGAEALVRWRKNDTLVPPYMFIPVLESDGSITELDFYMLDRVCQDLRQWIDEGLRVVRVSSNFSKLHLRNPDFAKDVLKVINKYDIPHELIEIELTESSGYENFTALSNFVTEMSSNDIFVAIDDFGTGYSSLSLLRDLSVDVIKIDKSLVDGIGSGKKSDENLLKNVINMIKELNKDIICEGVETVDQARILRSWKCYNVQGYLYDKPLEHDEFEIRLRDPKYNRINK
ncbi:MAG: GGDEF domain-containing phosphodiesterase [Lachnospiraceae bacterium]|nr:GGDEF domain-containing phosphodiesterase [Lachnospiraceae bacterium]